MTRHDCHTIHKLTDSFPLSLFPLRFTLLTAPLRSALSWTPDAAATEDDSSTAAAPALWEAWPRVALHALAGPAEGIDKV